MDEKIKIQLSDWQFNAGIVGFCNILEHAGDEIEKGNQHIEVKLQSLEKFAEKYFNYFIDKYNKHTPWYRIVSYKSVIESHRNNNFENFDEKSLECLNGYIKIAKDYLKRNNYKKVYPFIEHDADILKLEKELRPINLRKKDSIEDRLEDIKQTYKIIDNIINYCNTKTVKNI